jgi:hypothetical protein
MKSCLQVLIVLFIPVLFLFGLLMSGLAYNSFAYRIGIEIDIALAKPLAALGVDIDPLRRSKIGGLDRDPDRLCLPYPRVTKETSESGTNVKYRNVMYSVDPGDKNLARIDIQSWPDEAFLVSKAGRLDDIQCSAFSDEFDLLLNPFALAFYAVSSNRLLLDDRVIDALKNDADYFNRYFSPANAADPDNFIGKMNRRYPNIAPFDVEYRIEGNVFAFKLTGSRPAYVSGEWWLAIGLTLGSVFLFWYARREAGELKKRDPAEEQARD